MIQVKDHAHWPIGCDIQGDSVRIAQVSSASGNLKKLETACARLQDRNAAAETIAKLVQEGSFHGNEIVLPCPATLLQYRALQIVSMPAAELNNAAHWQFCRELELDPDKTISDFFVVGQTKVSDKTRLELICFGVDIAAITDWVRGFETHDLVPVGIDLAAAAMVRFANNRLAVSAMRHATSW